MDSESEEAEVFVGDVHFIHEPATVRKGRHLTFWIKGYNLSVNLKLLFWLALKMVSLFFLV